MEIANKLSEKSSQKLDILRSGCGFLLQLPKTLEESSGRA